MVPILVVIGVRTDNTRLVLLIQSGDKESATAWREAFRDLKGRGLDG
jgi:transposase-like protein